MLQPGDRTFRDLNNDGIINAQDKTIIGKSLPDLTLGLLNSWSYRNISCHIHLHGLFGREVANLNLFYLKDPTGSSNVLASFAQGDRDEQVPRKRARSNVFSDAQIQDGDFLRIQNVTLSYQLPEGLTQKIRADQCHIYVAVDNWWTITGYDGIDPDVSHFGQNAIWQAIDFDSYPKARTARLGIKIGF